MADTPGRSDPRNIAIRTIREGDVDDVVEMYSRVGVPMDAQTVRSWCEESPYTRRLVAEADGRAVGKVTLDTAYPPYSELVNLMVHPDHRRRGVASRLVRGCLEAAEGRRCPMTLLMTEPGNTAAINLYARNGFLTSVPGGPGEREHTWMIRLPDDSLAGRFNGEHASSLFTPPRDRTKFQDRPLYEMRWNDPETGDYLGFFLEGQPGQPAQGGTAPRIAGATVKEGTVTADILVLEGKTTVETGGDARFRLLTANNGEEDLHIEGIGHLHPEGVTMFEESALPMTMKPGKEAITRFKARLDPGFDVPILSFSTVLLTLSVRIRGVEAPILVTAGFERG
jgi:GNAT superfamily N-acetyltransferase